MKCGVLLNFTKASKNVCHNVCFKGKKKKNSSLKRQRDILTIRKNTLRKEHSKVDL